MLPSFQTFANRVWTRASRAEIGLISAGIAFFSFLAIFPALAAVITIWGYAADPFVVQSQLDLASDYLPVEAFDLLYGQVQRILATSNRTLGLASLLTTAFAIWSARAGVGALISGINAIHGLPGRNGFRHLLSAFILTMALIGLVMSAMVAGLVAPIAIHFLPLGQATSTALKLANFALGMFLVLTSIAVAYRLGPNRAGKATSLRFLTPGTLLAMVLWAGVSRGLVFYLSNFANYNQVYGSIGAVVALLMWFYLSSYAVLLGSAVDAELEAKRNQIPPA